jgi:cytochrome b561
MNQTYQRYTTTAIALHWAIALLIVVAFPLGLYMADLDPSPFRIKLVIWHKWIGITVLGLLLVRIYWRLTHRPPALPAEIPAYAVKLSAVVAFLMYVLMFAVPMVGWIHSSAAGHTVVWFNLIALPDLVGKDKPLAELTEDLHAALNWVLFGLVALHVAGALKHQFVAKIPFLQRMR